MTQRHLESAGDGFISNMPKDEFLAGRGKGQGICHGRRCCPGRPVAEVRAKFTVVDPFNIYGRCGLSTLRPICIISISGKAKIVGSSPEILVRVENGKIVLRPIAGTRRRGETEAVDKALEEELKRDPKEIAEHIMLVDLGRNDVGRVAKVGSVKVTGSDGSGAVQSCDASCVERGRRSERRS